MGNGDGDREFFLLLLRHGAKVAVESYIKQVAPSDEGAVAIGDWGRDAAKPRRAKNFCFVSLKAGGERAKR